MGFFEDCREAIFMKQNALVELVKARKPIYQL
jgi:hypothetical protein